MADTNLKRLTEVAVTIGVSYNRLLRVIMTGEVAGEYRDGKWYANMTSARRWLARQQKAVGS